MVPDRLFNQAAQILQEINNHPEHLKKISDPLRPVVLIALTNLQSYESHSEKTIQESLRILNDCRNGEIPKSSFVKRIQKAFQNRSNNRVTSTQLARALKQCEQELWFRQGEELFKKGNTDEAFTKLDNAAKKGSARAHTLLGQMFEQKQVSEDRRTVYLNTFGLHGPYFSKESVRKRHKSLDFDVELAREFYAKGADKGDPVAMRKIAERNLAIFDQSVKDKRPKQQFKKGALQWLKKAAKLGDAESAELLKKHAA